MNRERKKKLKIFFDKLVGVLNLYYDKPCIYTKQVEEHIRVVAKGVWKKCLLDREVDGEIPDIKLRLSVAGLLEISFMESKKCTCRLTSMIPREYDPDTGEYTCTNCGGVVCRDWYKGIFPTLSDDELADLFKKIGEYKKG